MENQKEPELNANANANANVQAQLSNNPTQPTQPTAQDQTQNQEKPQDQDQTKNQDQVQFCSCCKPADFFGFLNKRNSDMLGVDFAQTGFGPDFEPVCKISNSKTIFNKKK